MTKFDYIYEIAADNYGLVTTAEAEAAGVTRVEIARYATQGRLDRRARGIYRLTKWVPTPYDRFAEAVAIVGGDALLYGEGVLAMLELANANPRKIPVVTHRRVRKGIPAWVEVLQLRDVGGSASYMGIPCQCVVDAILACRGKIMDERLVQAAINARREGWIDIEEEREIREELEEWPKCRIAEGIST